MSKIGDGKPHTCGPRIFLFTKFVWMSKFIKLKKWLSANNWVSGCCSDPMFSSREARKILRKTLFTEPALELFHEKADSMSSITVFSFFPSSKQALKLILRGCMVVRKYFWPR